MNMTNSIINRNICRLVDLCRSNSILFVDDLIYYGTDLKLLKEFRKKDDEIIWDEKLGVKIFFWHSREASQKKIFRCIQVRRLVVLSTIIFVVSKSIEF